jgi:hypothetical protein
MPPLLSFPLILLPLRMLPCDLQCFPPRIFLFCLLEPLEQFFGRVNYFHVLLYETIEIPEKGMCRS